MHAIQPAPEPLAAKLQRLQSDALETVHWVMLHMVRSLTDPQDNDPASQVTTQRARLCLQAARDILRFRPPVTPDKPDDDSPPSPAMQERVAAVCSGGERTKAGSQDVRDAIAPPRGRVSVPPSRPGLSSGPREGSRLSEQIDSPLPLHVPAPAPIHDSPPDTQDSLPPSSTPLPPSSHDGGTGVHLPAGASGSHEIRSGAHGTSLVAHASGFPPGRVVLQPS